MTDDRLARITAHEAARRHTLMTDILRRVGQTRLFAAIYSRIGPGLDRWMMRLGGGKVANQVHGLPALLLTTTGAKSGQPRTSPLLYLRDGDTFIVVGTNFGKTDHPAWSGNLLAHPDAIAEIGPERLPVRAELADQATWDRCFPQCVALYPGYEKYLETCGDRKPRMFILRPTG